MRHLLFVVIFFLLAFSLCEAAVISPELQTVLQTVPSGQEIPVIINLADKADVNQIITPAGNTREGEGTQKKCGRQGAQGQGR